MSCLLLILTFLMICITTACAQPVQEPPKKDAPATPETQHQPRQSVDARPCEVPLRNDSGIQPNTRLDNVCGNHQGTVRVITKVQCQTKQGTLVFRPRLSGGEATSILASPLTCTTTPSVGVLNGRPRLQSYVPNSAVCPGACSVDFIVETVDGAKEAVLTIVGEYE